MTESEPELLGGKEMDGRRAVGMEVAAAQVAALVKGLLWLDEAAGGNARTGRET